MKEKEIRTNLISLQFALFFSEVVDRPFQEFSDLNQNMLNIFDADPTVIPIPPQLPPDVAVATYRSTDGRYVCAIARSRIDLHCVCPSAKDSDDVLKDFNAKVRGFVPYVLGKRSVSRFGMIARYFYIDSTATHTLRKKYFSNAVGDVSELSLRFNKTSEHFGHKINDVVELAAVQAEIAGESKFGVYVQRDINNVEISGEKVSRDKLQEMSAKFAESLKPRQIEGLIK